MTALLQIWKFAITAAEWVPLICPVEGSCLKAWFNYDGDLHLRSDANNGQTDFLCVFAKGDQFDLPFLTAVTLDGDRPLVYAQAASGTVNVTLFCMMQ